MKKLPLFDQFFAHAKANPHEVAPNVGTGIVVGKVAAGDVLEDPRRGIFAVAKKKAEPIKRRAKRFTPVVPQKRGTHDPMVIVNTNACFNCGHAAMGNIAVSTADATVNEDYLFCGPICMHHYLGKNEPSMYS